MENQNSKKVIVEFSGWIELGENQLFQNISTGETITAKQYSELNSDERGEYMLDSFCKSCSECDGELDIDCTIEQN